jgi:DNA repair exonuclease SbcCD ATPase subunit
MWLVAFEEMFDRLADEGIDVDVLDEIVQPPRDSFAAEVSSLRDALNQARQEAAEEIADYRQEIQYESEARNATLSQLAAAKATITEARQWIVNCVNPAEVGVEVKAEMLAKLDEALRNGSVTCAVCGALPHGIHNGEKHDKLVAAQTTIARVEALAAELARDVPAVEQPEALAVAAHSRYIAGRLAAALGSRDLRDTIKEELLDRLDAALWSRDGVSGSQEEGASS